MAQCASVLAMLDAPHRLHQCKAMKRSEADVLAHQLRDLRDFMLALEPHREALRALLSGVQIVPASAAHAAITRAGEDGE